MSSNLNNPFELVTASKLSAEEAIELWCDDKRLVRVSGKENCFVNGHRGTGKSMLFRILQFDCQQRLGTSPEVPFISVYFPVRDTECLIEEFNVYQRHEAKDLISESHLSILIAINFIALISDHPEIVPALLRESFTSIVRNCLERSYRFSEADMPIIDYTNFENFLSGLDNVLQLERERIVHFIGRRLSESRAFDGPLILFDNFLGPVGRFFSNQLGQNLFILIDDGDDLPEAHTVVLNSWIARRNSNVVFKVSTMFGYKTYKTRGHSAIQHPHDFFQYEIASRFLNDSAEDYVKLLEEICIKRLKVAGIVDAHKISVKEFFPEDEKQRREIEILSGELLEKYSRKWSGRAVQDYEYRHRTSEYMKKLWRSRALDSYSYSGFHVLATLSSGLVRDFIICAQRMFDRAARSEDPVVRISPSIQNRVVREHADNVFDEIENPTQMRNRDATPSDWRMVRNLIEGLGSIFKTKMLSEDSERRIFSFALQDTADAETNRVLELAVAESYLMKGYISRKERTGRRTLYVLTRRLAPRYSLDPSAYSGYLSISEGQVKELMEFGATRPPHAAEGQLTFFELGLSEGDEWSVISHGEAGL